MRLVDANLLSEGVIFMKTNLGDVQETMLIPLCIKANETLRKNARIKDQKAVEIIESLDVDREKFDKFLSHEGVIARTVMIDKYLKNYIAKYPEAVIVNMGCGLCNRFERVDNGSVQWFDLDLPDAIAFRRKFYEEHPRVTMVEGSILESAWTKKIPKDRKIIFIAEGLLMYFSQYEVKKILNILACSFSDFILIAELIAPITSHMSKCHDTIKSTSASFGWGTKSGRELEELCGGLKLISEESLNKEAKKHTVRGFIFASIPVIKDFNDRLAIYEYKK